MNEKLEAYKAKLEARLSKINREDFSINDLQFTMTLARMPIN